MKLKTGVLVIFLVFGLLGVPNCIFAQDYDYSSNAVLESSVPTITQATGLNFEVKGGFSSAKSASKTIKKISDGDDDDTGGDSGDGGSGWVTAIIIIVIIAIIAIAAWYFFLRK